MSVGVYGLSDSVYLCAVLSLLRQWKVERVPPKLQLELHEAMMAKNMRKNEEKLETANTKLYGQKIN